MFKKAQHIDSAFRHIRLFSLLFLAGCTCVCIVVSYKSYSIATTAQERIFILANGKALEAYSADRRDNIPVEARDHVKMFHHYFFTLDPDDKVIKANITKALYLSDGSAKEQYDNLKENGYYSNLISGNISQEIEADSVVISTDSYPYYFRYYGKQLIIRPSTLVKRSIITEGYLRNVSRSDHNSHGLLIERWRTIENKDVSIENRNLP